MSEPFVPGSNETRRPGEAPRLKVFVSYSRADAEAFAEELTLGLEFSGGIEVSLDRHSIVEGEVWKDRLGALVAEADTVVFVVSPASIRSSVCAWEVEEARRLSKRILPVLWIEPEAGQQTPEHLAELNYTRFDGERSFMASLKALVAALNTDLAWLREHTRLLNRALEWQRANRIENRMLSGADIEEAKRWAARRPKDAPAPTDLHMDYIRASEVMEKARSDALVRQNEERARLLKEAEEAARERAAALTSAEKALRATARLQRRQAIAAGLAVIVLAAAGWSAWGLMEERRTMSREAAREDIRGQILSYATARGESAADTAPGHLTSPYTTAIARRLTQPRRSIVDSLVDAHKEVVDLSAGGQRPLLSTSMNGHVYLTDQPAARRKKAILLAVDNPNIGGHGILNAPRHDMEAIARSLLSVGFAPSEIVRLYNVDAAALDEAIGAAARDLSGGARKESAWPDGYLHRAGLQVIKPSAETPRNSLMVFYFSGHGVEADGFDYLVPRMPGGRVNGPADLAREAIPVSQLTKRLEDIAAASIVMLDTHFPALTGGSR